MLNLVEMAVENDVSSVFDQMTGSRRQYASHEDISKEPRRRRHRAAVDSEAT